MLYIFGMVATSAVALTVWANQDGVAAATPAEPSQSKKSIRALADFNEPVPFVPEPERHPVKPGVWGMAKGGSGTDRVIPQSDPAANASDANARERTRAIMQRADVRGKAANDQQRGRAARPTKQVVPHGDRAMGRDALTELPWGWTGFGPYGFQSSQIVGYRSFGYPFGIGGPVLSGHRCHFKGCCRFGFPAVSVGISGPVTIYYDEPLLRQWKLVDEGMKNLATGRSNR
jgi:hypothetical protein